MKYKEETIAVFKYGKNKYNLLKITEDYTFTEDPPFTTYAEKYLIIKNRKRLYNTRWENQAKAKFSQYIVGELMQQKISF